MDISWRGEVCDAPHLLECIYVDSKNHVRVIHHNPPDAVTHNHRLRHVTQLHSIRAVEDLILHLARCGVVVRERSITILEVTLVGNEQAPTLSRELLLVTRLPLHTATQQEQLKRGGNKHYDL